MSAGSITQADYDRALLVIDAFGLVGTTRERLASVMGQELASERERNRQESITEGSRRDMEREL